MNEQCPAIGDECSRCLGLGKTAFIREALRRGSAPQTTLMLAENAQLAGLLENKHLAAIPCEERQRVAHRTGVARAAKLIDGVDLDS